MPNPIRSLFSVVWKIEFVSCVESISIWRNTQQHKFQFTQYSGKSSSSALASFTFSRLRNRLPFPAYSRTIQGISSSGVTIVMKRMRFLWFITELIAASRNVNAMSVGSRSGLRTVTFFTATVTPFSVLPANSKFQYETPRMSNIISMRIMPVTFPYGSKRSLSNEPFQF